VQNWTNLKSLIASARGLEEPGGNELNPKLTPTKHQLGVWLQTSHASTYDYKQHMKTHEDNELLSR